MPSEKLPTMNGNINKAENYWRNTPHDSQAISKSKYIIVFEPNRFIDLACEHRANCLLERQSYCYILDQDEITVKNPTSVLWHWPTFTHRKLKCGNAIFTIDRELHPCLVLACFCKCLRERQKVVVIK